MSYQNGINVNNQQQPQWPSLEEFQQQFQERDFTSDKALYENMNTVLRDVADFTTRPQVDRQPAYSNTNQHGYHEIHINQSQGPSWWEMFCWSSLLSRSNSGSTNVYVNNGQNNQPVHSHQKRKEKENNKTALVVVGVALSLFALGIGWCLGKNLATLKKASQAQADLETLKQTYGWTHVQHNMNVNSQMQSFFHETKKFLDLVENHAFTRSVMKVVALSAALTAIVGCFAGVPAVAAVGGLVLLVDAIAYMIFAGMTSGETEEINKSYTHLCQQAAQVQQSISNYLVAQPDYVHLPQAV